MSSTHTEDTLRESIYWRDRRITHVRRLRTSYNVRLTFPGKGMPRYILCDTLLVPVQHYKKPVPACGLRGPSVTTLTPSLAQTGHLWHLRFRRGVRRRRACTTRVHTSAHEYHTSAQALSLRRTRCHRGPNVQGKIPHALSPNRAPTPPDNSQKYEPNKKRNLHQEDSPPKSTHLQPPQQGSETREPPQSG